MEDTSKSKEDLIFELKELRKQNRLLTGLIENSKDLIYRMSLPQGRYEYVNSASTEVSGYSPEEFYQSPMLIREIIHPDWEDYFETQWALIVDGDIPPFYEYQIIDKSGKTRWLYQNNVLVKDKDGTPTAIEGVVSNITERKNIEAELKKSEASLKEAQKMANIGSWYWHIKTGEVEWSEEVFNIFQLNPDEFRPQIDSILSLSPWPEDHQRGEELMQKAIKNREKGSYEQRFLLADGETGYYFSTFQGVYDEDGNLTAIRGTIQNITDRKKAEKEKAHLEEQYRQAQKVESIGRLAGGVAHDLNNLLTPILGYSEILLEDFSSNDKECSLVSEIQTAGLRAKNLVGQLLAFSRKQALEYITLDMNQVIKGIQKLLKRTIRENIKIKIITSDTPQTIRADIGQIEQVILNLAVNAQDAMPEGGILTIETTRVRHNEEHVDARYDIQSGEFVMLTISDSGCGMDDFTREKIFEPFFSTKGEMGTGLGLATVYGIVKQHEGNIYVYSELNKGTVFKVYLPYHRALAEKLPSKEDVGELSGSETILLAEDDENVRSLTIAVLKRYGYKVIETENGYKALDALDSFNDPVHLLLTDVIMPGLNGKDLYTKAAQKCPGLKVIYLSGYTDNVIAHHGILDDGIQLVQKPFSVKTLTAKIREVLNEP